MKKLKIFLLVASIVLLFATGCKSEIKEEMAQDGIGIVWKGELDAAPSEPQTNWAYYNTADRKSYIYDNGSWQILSQDGTNGVDGKDGQDGSASNVQGGSVEATPRGIKFTGTILSNADVVGVDSISAFAAVEIKITEKKSGITMVRNWKKGANAWDSVEMFYPFVDANKEYEFSLSATSGNYTIAEFDGIKITATGGLGEYRIENAEEYAESTELTPERVVKRTATATYTENPKVKKIREGIDYAVFDGDWSWVFADTKYFTDGSRGQFDIKKDAPAWRKFDQIDSALKGGYYYITSQTRVYIAGYFDNGETYFQMGDKSELHDEWEPGSKKVKVYVIYGDQDLMTSTKKNVADIYNDLPGTPTTFTFTMKNYDGKLKSVDMKLNCDVVNYSAAIYEPAAFPTYKNVPNSEFAGWDVIFPYKLYPPKMMGMSDEDIERNGSELSVNGEKAEYIYFLKPNVKANTKITVDLKTKISIWTPVENGGIPGEALGGNEGESGTPNGEGTVKEGDTVNGENPPQSTTYELKEVIIDLGPREIDLDDVYGYSREMSMARYDGSIEGQRIEFNYDSNFRNWDFEFQKDDDCYLLVPNCFITGDVPLNKEGGGNYAAYARNEY